MNKDEEMGKEMTCLKNIVGTFSGSYGSNGVSLERIDQGSWGKLDYIRLREEWCENEYCM